MGKEKLGLFPLRRDGTIRWGALDIDDEALFEPIVEKLRVKGITFIFERSKSKGYHIYFFFKKPVKAIQFREYIKQNLGSLITNKVEIIPYHDFLRENILGKAISLGNDNEKTVSFNCFGVEIDIKNFKSEIELLAIDTKKIEEIQVQPQKIIKRTKTEKIKYENEENFLPCMKIFLKSEIEPGERNVLLFHACKHLFKYSGIDVLSFLKAINENFKEPLDEEEVNSIYNSVETKQYSSLGCEDPNWAKFCPGKENCPVFWKKRNRKEIQNNFDEELEEAKDEIPSPPYVYREGDLILFKKKKKVKVLTQDFFEVKKKLVDINGGAIFVLKTKEGELVLNAKTDCDNRRLVSKFAETGIYSYFTNQEEVSAFFQFLEREAPSTIKYADQFGFFEIDGRKRCFINGYVIDEEKILETFRSEISFPFVSKKILEENDWVTGMESFINLSLLYKDLKPLGTILGWLSASTLKNELPEKTFPILFVCGAAESGKTTLLELLAPLFSVESKLNSDVSSFSLRTLISKSKDFPLILDEFTHQENITLHLKSIFNELEVSRGNPNQTITLWKLQAPLALISQSDLEERADMDRIIRVVLTADNFTPDSLEIVNDIQKRPLSHLARSFINFRLKYDVRGEYEKFKKDGIFEFLKINEEKVPPEDISLLRAQLKTLMKIIRFRNLLNFRKVLFGLRFLYDFFKHFERSSLQENILDFIYELFYQTVIFFFSEGFSGKEDYVDYIILLINEILTEKLETPLVHFENDILTFSSSAVYTELNRKYKLKHSQRFYSLSLSGSRKKEICLPVKKMLDGKQFKGFKINLREFFKEYGSDFFSNYDDLKRALMNALTKIHFKS